MVDSSYFYQGCNDETVSLDHFGGGDDDVDDDNCCDTQRRTRNASLELESVHLPHSQGVRQLSSMPAEVLVLGAAH